MMEQVIQCLMIVCLVGVLYVLYRIAAMLSFDEFAEPVDNSHLDDYPDVIYPKHEVRPDPADDYAGAGDLDLYEKANRKTEPEQKPFWEDPKQLSEALDTGAFDFREDIPLHINELPPLDRQREIAERILELEKRK